MKTIVIVIGLWWLLFDAGNLHAEPVYDIVIVGGRVVDPESGVNEIKNVAVNGDRIVAISDDPLKGGITIDAQGHIVTAGFIDLHSHAQTKLGQSYQVRDGVTTALELEAGAYPVGAVGNQIADRPLINFGASAAYAAMRTKVLANLDTPYLFFGKTRMSFKDPGFVDPLSQDQIASVMRHVGLGIDQGGLGVGLLLDYMGDAISDEELRALFATAAERQAPIFIHIKRGVAGDVTGLDEVIGLAKATGASIHICHLNANAMGAIDVFLRRIDLAREAGVDITAESYPYNAGSTSIGADVFNRDWQTIFGITYEDVQLADTGEYFNKDRWEEVRTANPGASIIHHYGREEWTRKAILAPGMMIGSDAMPVFSEAIKNHPRGIGTFSRVLSEYVRKTGILKLEEALAKMSYLPAKRMQGIAPRFERKGRLQVGADADIVIFNADLIEDKASYAAPYQASVGMSVVLVNGQIVVNENGIVPGVYPGRLIVGSE